MQALESGYDAVGVDIAAFNALLISVKTREHDLAALEADVRAVGESLGESSERPQGFVARRGSRRRRPRSCSTSGR